MTRIVLFEDNTDVVESLVDLFATSDGMSLVAHFGNCKDAARKAMPLQPDVILMDIDMPHASGLQGLREIRQADENVCVLMFTVFDDNDRVFQAVCDGASGYLLKDTPPDTLLQSIREAQHGGAPMTPSVARKVLQMFAQPFKHKRDMAQLTAREQDVLTLLVRGFSYKMVAVELHISLDTVRSHIKSIFTKLHVNSKSEAVAKALQNKLA